MDVFSSDLICGSRDKPFSCRSPPRCFRSSHMSCVMISASSTTVPSNHTRSCRGLPYFHVEWQLEDLERSDEWNVANVRHWAMNQRTMSQGTCVFTPSSVLHAAHAGCEIPRWGRQCTMQKGTEVRGVASGVGTGILLVSRRWIASVQATPLDCFVPTLGHCSPSGRLLRQEVVSMQERTRR